MTLHTDTETFTEYRIVWHEGGVQNDRIFLNRDIAEEIARNISAGSGERKADGGQVVFQTRDVHTSTIYTEWEVVT